MTLLNGKTPIQFSAELHQLAAAGLLCADILDDLAADAAEGGGAPEFVAEARAAVSSFHAAFQVFLTHPQ